MCICIRCLCFCLGVCVCNMVTRSGAAQKLVKFWKGIRCQIGHCLQLTSLVKQASWNLQDGAVMCQPYPGSPIHFFTGKLCALSIVLLMKYFENLSRKDDRNENQRVRKKTLKKWKWNMIVGEILCCKVFWRDENDDFFKKKFNHNSTNIKLTKNGV